MKLPPAAFEVFKRALRECRRDIAAETNQRIIAARARLDRDTDLIDRAREDKLEGRIDADLFYRKHGEWEEARGAAMLEILLPSCTLAGGELTPQHRRPFNILVEGARSLNGGGPPSRGHEGGLPRGSA